MIRKSIERSATHHDENCISKAREAGETTSNLANELMQINDRAASMMDG